MDHNPIFLHQKFRDLNTSPEVENIVKRRAKKTGEKEIPPQKPDERVQAYLDYLKECATLKDEHKRAEKLGHIKQVLRDKYVTKKEDIPESYWARIIRRHRREGHGDIEIPLEQKDELAADIATEQTNSLNKWIDYLSLPDAEYPDWFKYFAIRSVLRLNRYDKKEKKFTERTKGTVSPFPDRNQDALGFVCDALDKKQSGVEFKFGYDIAPEDQQQFRQYLQQENFAKMYAWATDHFSPIPKELLKKTAGEWLSFPKGSDPQKLVEAISKYSTGWCIRGEATAARYLSHSDLEIYFSEDQDGKYTIPRVVVVRRNNQTTEIRGIGPEENTDPDINEVVKQKIAQLPDGKEYEKKSSDMVFLSAIEDKFDKKIKRWSETLTRAELVFLYEIESTIDGFGYPSVSGDPRIKELRGYRDPKVDAPIVFDCGPNQIAHNLNEITADTKAYIGPLVPNIFKLISHLDHIYAKFPEGKIRQESVEIDKNKTPAQYLAEFKKLGIKIYEYAKYMLECMGGARDKDQQVGLVDKIKKGMFGKEDKQTTEQVDMVRLTVADLGFPNGATKEQIYQKAEELGLELCPAEVGPQYRLQYTNQPMNEWVYVGMEPISGPDGGPSVFHVVHDTDGVYLYYYWALPGDHWGAGARILFRLRK